MVDATRAIRVQNLVLSAVTRHPNMLEVNTSRFHKIIVTDIDWAQWTLASLLVPTVSTKLLLLLAIASYKHLTDGIHIILRIID